MHKEIIDFQDNSIATGRLIILEINVKSNVLEEYKYLSIYGFYENESFCSKILLPMNSEIFHIIYIRYGGGYSWEQRCYGYQMY